MFFLKDFFPPRLFSAGVGLCIAVFLLSIGGSGCASAPPENAVEPTPLEQRVETRSRELADLLRPLPVRGVAMALPSSLTPEEAAQIIATTRKCGFNRLYLTVDRISAFRDSDDDALDILLAATAGSDIRTVLVLRQSHFVRQFRGNAFLRLFRSETPDLPEAARAAADFIDGLDEDERPCGVVLVVEPHRFVSANVDRPQGELFAWSETSYGAGLDNDVLMGKALAELAAAAQALAPIPVTAGIADFYQEKAQSGELSRGFIADFQKITPSLLVYNSGNKPSEAAAAVESELAVDPVENSMQIAITIAPHTAISHGSLRRRNWDDLVRALNYAVEKWQVYPSFAGVVIGPFHLIQRLQAEE